MANVPPKRQDFDAIVVGSGATGGWAAKELTEAGLHVALVEAGRNLVPEKDFTEHVNLFIMNGSSFVSSGCQNPTLLYYDGP